MSEAELGICLTEGCDKRATMVCPPCQKIGRRSFFCSQEHFKEAWPMHKKTHPPPKRVPPPGVNVVSTAGDIERATETLRRIRDLAQTAAATSCPVLSTEAAAKCKTKLEGTAGVRAAKWASGNFGELLTPNTMMRFETPRLVVRSVQPSDSAWIYSVKGDPRVNKYQFYDQPRGREHAMTLYGNGYIRDRIPLLFGLAADESVGRCRYVFAITPKADEIPAPSSNAIPRVPGLASFSALPHQHDTYIGNVAFEIYPLKNVVTGTLVAEPLGPACLRIPGKDVFRWPDIESDAVRQDLDGWAALLFYEIAPQYWGQGLMSEAILSVTDFVFFELGLGALALDPRTDNAASIALARKLPDMAYASTNPSRASASIKQHVFVLSRADYVRRFAAPHDSLQPAAGKKGCAWCYNPRALVRGEGETCPRCSKRWYCGLECRAADWAAQGGHGVRCGE